MRTSTGPSRRDFLHAGPLAAGVAGLSLANLGRASPRADVNCILLFLTGGPSQLDTWDLKPAAPSHVRGPFRPIRTSAPGVEICEHFPRMAKLARHYALLRSVHHDAAPIHETGQQLLQTGHLCRGGREYPHYGAVVSHARGRRHLGIPPFVILGGPIGNTGVNISHGQSAGFLGPQHEPAYLAPEPGDGEARYGNTPFGRSCLLARRLVERGVRFVTVNMFDTVFDRVTWDCHADGGSLPADLDDYKNVLCPMFDLAYSALLEDLHQRGLLSNTLVVALGEFGRTPHLNPRGGRDHWPGVWSVLFAGAGVRGGQVVGSSDRLGGEPKDRPTTPAEVAATVYHLLGIDPRSRLVGEESLVSAEPVRELFGA